VYRIRREILRRKWPLIDRVYQVTHYVVIIWWRFSLCQGQGYLCIIGSGAGDIAVKVECHLCVGLQEVERSHVVAAEAVGYCCRIEPLASLIDDEHIISLILPVVRACPLNPERINTLGRNHFQGAVLASVAGDRVPDLKRLQGTCVHLDL